LAARKQALISRRNGILREIKEKLSVVSFKIHFTQSLIDAAIIMNQREER